MSPRLPRRFQYGFRLLRIYTSLDVSAIAVYGRNSGDFDDRDAVQERRLEDVDRRPEDGLTGRNSLHGLAPRGEAAHEVGRDDQEVRIAAAGSCGLQRVADQVGRSVRTGVGRAVRDVGLDDLA